MKESRGYYRYKGALGGVLLGLVLSVAIIIAFGNPVPNLLRRIDLYEPVLRLGGLARTAVQMGHFVVFVVLGATLGAIFPKFFAWAWHLIPSGDE